MNRHLRQQLHGLAILLHRLIGTTFVLLVIATALALFTDGLPRFLGVLGLSTATLTELFLLAISTKIDALLKPQTRPAPTAPTYQGPPRLYVVR